MANIEERISELDSRLSATAADIERRIAARLGRNVAKLPAESAVAVGRGAPIAPFKSAGVRYGLFVGVNKYDQGAYQKLGCFRPNPATGKFVDNLTGCAPDARNMAAVCKELGGWENETVLIDSAAKISAVRGALGELALTAKPGDEVLYFHSGHGGPNPFGETKSNDTALMLHDGLYQENELRDDLAKFHPGVKVVVVIDTCHSAGLFEKSSPGIASERPSAFPGGFTIPLFGEMENVGWIVAAGADQTSLDTRYGNGGYFTTLTLINSGWRGGMAKGASGSECANGGVSFLDLACFARGVWENWLSYDVTDGGWKPHVPQYGNPKLLASVIAGRTGVASGSEGGLNDPAEQPKETNMNKNPKNFTETLDLDSAARNWSASATRRSAEAAETADSVQRAASSNSALAKVLKAALGRSAAPKDGARYKEYTDCSFGTIQG